jgi:hypothetical protein
MNKLHRTNGVMFPFEPCMQLQSNVVARRRRSEDVDPVPVGELSQPRPGRGAGSCFTSEDLYYSSGVSPTHET